MFSPTRSYKSMSLVDPAPITPSFSRHARVALLSAMPVVSTKSSMRAFMADTVADEPSSITFLIVDDTNNLIDAESVRVPIAWSVPLQEDEDVDDEDDELETDDEDEVDSDDDEDVDDEDVDDVDEDDELLAEEDDDEVTCPAVEEDELVELLLEIEEDVDKVEDELEDEDEEVEEDELEDELVELLLEDEEDVVIAAVLEDENEVVELLSVLRDDSDSVCEDELRATVLDVERATVLELERATVLDVLISPDWNAPRSHTSPAIKSCLMSMFCS